MKGILEMGHFPVGMELFSAKDESVWNSIKEQIDNCDYYIIIIGSRYGSVDDRGVSYTEREFDYANEKDIPILSFVQKDAPISDSAEDSKKQISLIRFKERVQQRYTKFWTNKNDLHVACITAMHHIFQKNPRNGWRKYSEAEEINAKTVNEFANLASENKQLKDKVAILEINIMKEELAKDEDNKLTELFKILDKKLYPLAYWYQNSTNWEKIQVQLSNIFFTLSIEMVRPQSEDTIMDKLLVFGKKTDLTEFREKYPMPTNVIKQLLRLFAAMDIMKEVFFDNGFSMWVMTEKGKKLMNLILLKQVGL